MSSTSSSLTTTGTSFSPTQTPTTTTTPTTSDTPFFPDPATIIKPSSTWTNQNDEDADLVKTVLEWLFLVVALVTLGSIVAWRFLQLRQRNRPLTEFFTRQRDRRRTQSFSSARTVSSERPQRVTLYSDSGVDIRTYYPYLSTPSAAHTYQTRRTRGADVDAFGRRTGAGGDYDEPSDKDELPAYEHAGGPPKYVDLELGRLTLRNRTGTGEDGTASPSTQQEPQDGTPVPTSVPPSESPVPCQSPEFSTEDGVQVPSPARPSEELPTAPNPPSIPSATQDEDQLPPSPRPPDPEPNTSPPDALEANERIPPPPAPTVSSDPPHPQS
ncbi:hypothetical protein ONZ45_g12183 [Pleurotus djamor]|nr:hypothetical protein ONZ45_g12183 [Pleurotus djamor]